VTSILEIVSLGAAVITGALGDGYSSITVPIALPLVSNRLLNPALVVVEVAVSCCSAVFNRRRSARSGAASSSWRSGSYRASCWDRCCCRWPQTGTRGGSAAVGVGDL
jgi:hypothetical protein